MLTSEQDESTYRVRYSSYVLPVILLCIPPLMLYGLGPKLLDDTIRTGELVGLVIGLLLPLAAAYFFIEFASFTFSLSDDTFSWRWRNLFRRSSGKVPFHRVVRVHREGLESGDSAGLHYRYRLVVVLDDGTSIPLTRGYSGIYDRKLGQIVDQIRDFLGHAG